MKGRRIGILMVSVVVLIVVAGCGLLPFSLPGAVTTENGVPSPDAPAEVQPEAVMAASTPAVEGPTPVPEIAAEAEDKIVEIIPTEKIFDLPGIKSYRSRILWAMTGPAFEDESFAGIEMFGEYIKDQQAQRILWGEGDDTFEMIQIGDQSWVKFGDSWMQSSASDVPDFSEGLSWFSIYDFESDISKYKRVGREVVNGINTTHYTFDEKLFQEFFGASLLGISKIDKARGDVYLADEGFVVKSVIVLEGVGINEDKPDLSGAFRMEHELSDFNAPFSIEPPTMKSLADTFGFDVPLPEGAQSKFAMEGMATYVVANMTVEEVVSFYKNEMETIGFELDTTFSSEDEDSGFFMFTKGEQSLNISMSKVDDTVEITFMSW